MGTPAPTPKPSKTRKGSPQDTSLPGFIIPKLAGNLQLLMKRSQPVLFWLRGKKQLDLLDMGCRSHSAEKEKMFVMLFRPSSHMVSPCVLPVRMHVSSMFMSTQIL
jgi:hypothetical protein